MEMPSDSGAMAMLAVGSVCMSISSQSSVHAACARRRRNDAKEVCLPIVKCMSRSILDVSGHRVHLSLA
eukprot:6188944-Pleurochrysis_carterae.AAC.4